MDDARYEKVSRWRAVAAGLPPALLLFVLGGYWTLMSWGVVGDARPSRLVEATGPIVAGFGVALAYVVLRRSR